MGTRLIIEGNAVYEIDEDCRSCGKRYNHELPEAKDQKPEDKDKKTTVKPKLEAPF